MTLHVVPTFGRGDHAEINGELARLGAGRRVLVAVHRGTFGGTIVENTAKAVHAALRRGGDLVEVDVVRSTDGDLFCFHDGYEPYHFGIDDNLNAMSTAAIEELRYRWIAPEQGVERLQTVLHRNPSAMLNLDRAWNVFDTLLPALEREPRPGRFLVKAPMIDEALDQLERCETKFPFMGMVRSQQHIEDLLSRDRINLVAVEVAAATPDDEFADPGVIAAIKAEGLLVWANSLNLADGLERYAGFTDEVSVLGDPALGWGEMVARGIDIIQTDWPDLLSAHLRERGNAPDSRDVPN